MRALILGGSGFIGTALVRALHGLGARVSLLNRGTRLVGGTTQLSADRNDVGQLVGVASTHDEVDVVFDLCCYSRQHVEGAWHALSPLTRRWIHMSSAAVYLDPVSEAPSEDAAIGGAAVWGWYGRGKAEAEGMLNQIRSGIPRVIVRSPYVYGPGNSPRREAFIWDRLERGRTIYVPGTGTARVQFIHVDDLSRALVMLATVPASNVLVLNVAHEEQMSVREYVRRLAEVSGNVDSAVTVGALGKGLDPTAYFPFPNYPCRVDARRIAELYGWTAQWSFSSGHRQAFLTRDSAAGGVSATPEEDEIARRLLHHGE